MTIRFPISHPNSDYLKIEPCKPTKEPWNKGVDKSQIAEKIEVMSRQSKSDNPQDRVGIVLPIDHAYSY